MGGAISRLRGAVFTRPLQRFNAEERAQRIIEQEKPAPAPHYPIDQKVRESISHDQPHIREEITNKNEDLVARLKEVYVQSRDVGPDPEQLNRIEDPDRPLPQKVDPRFRLDFDHSHVFNSLEIAEKPGKLRLPVIEDVLAKHMADPKEHNAETIANTYDIDKALARDLLNHFSVFTYHVTDSSNEHAKQDPLLPQSDWEEVKDPPPKGLPSK